MSLTQSFAQLNLHAQDLQEGTVSLLEQPFSPTAFSHFSTVIFVANTFWGTLSFANLPHLSAGFALLNKHMTDFVQSPYRQQPSNPNVKKLRQQLSTLLIHINVRLQSDPILFATILQNPQQKKCFSDLCLLHAIMAYENIAAQCLANSPSEPKYIAQVAKDIWVSRNAFKLSDRHHVPYSNIELQTQINGIKKELLRKIYIINTLYNPNALGFKELQFHLDRKNQLATEKKSGFHGKLVFNLDTFTQHQIDPSVLITLVANIQQIKEQTQPRTQFIVDVLGQGHAMLLDIGYQPETQKIEILCIEPACLGYQAEFLQQLSTALTHAGIMTREIIAIQTGLLKDYDSCYTFSLALASAISQFHFADIQQHPAIAQPDFLCGTARKSLAPLDEVSWRDITALGKKIIMMGHSFSEMKINLCKLFPLENEEKIDGYIRDLKSSYILKPSDLALCDEVEKTFSYIHARRHSLRQRASTTPFSDLTIEQLLTKTKANSVGLALRRLAAGFGSCREMEYLLSKVDSRVVNEISEKTGRTALHFAYANGKIGRAYHLEKANADQTICDKEQKMPSELHFCKMQFNEKCKTSCCSAQKHTP